MVAELRRTRPPAKIAYLGLARVDFVVPSPDIPNVEPRIVEGSAISRAAIFFKKSLKNLLTAIAYRCNLCMLTFVIDKPES